MRGVVTLAAAFVIPEGTEHREILLLIAFTVVAGTLFIQGLTLPWLARRLKVPLPDPAEDALARATLLQQASQGGLEVLEAEEYDDPHGVVDSIRQRLDQRNFAAWEQLGDHHRPGVAQRPLRPDPAGDDRRRAAAGARDPQRRPGGLTTWSAEVLAMLDVEESMLDSATAGARGAPGGQQPAAADRRDLRRPREAPGRARTPRAGVRGVRRARASRWVHCARAWTAATSAAATPHPASTPPRTSARPTHPVMQSAEAGEYWRWCYVHHLTA